MAVLLAAATVSTVAWQRTRRRLRQTHIEREDLANSSLVIEEERRMLDLMARGASLGEVLDTLTRAIERISAGSIATVLLLDEEHRRFLVKGSGPSMPDEFLQSVNGLEIGPDVGACGSAAFRNETVVIHDIATDYRFAGARDFVMSFGLRSCWSVPVRDSRGIVLGTFAMYHRYPSTPRAEELRMTRVAAQLAGNAIERIRAERTLRETTGRLHLAERVAQFGIWEADFAKGTMTMSDALAAMIGRDGAPRRVSIDDFLSLVHPDDIEALRCEMQKPRKSEETIQGEFRLILPGGAIRWMRSQWRFDRISAQDGSSPTRATGAMVDITEEKDILVSLENARVAAEGAAATAREAGRLEQDRKTILELVAKDQPLEQILLVIASAATRHLPGSFCSIQIGLPDGSRISISPRLPQPLAAALADLPMASLQGTLLPQPVRQLSACSGWQTCLDKSEGVVPSDYRAVPILRNGRVTGAIISFFEDPCGCPEHTLAKDPVLESWGQFASLAVERRGLYEQLSFRARYDSLTSLLNRASLIERLDEQVSRSAHEGGALAVLYLDLDHFKEINDRQGHAAGDLVLQHVSRQILNSIRHTDLAARIGGDEFVVILTGVGDRHEASRVGDLIAESIVDSGGSGSEFHPRVSYGISLFPQDGDGTDALLAKADEEMYRAKLKRRRLELTNPDSTPSDASAPRLVSV